MQRPLFNSEKNLHKVAYEPIFIFQRVLKQKSLERELKKHHMLFYTCIKCVLPRWYYNQIFAPVV